MFNKNVPNVLFECVFFKFKLKAAKNIMQIIKKLKFGNKELRNTHNDLLKMWNLKKMKMTE